MSKSEKGSVSVVLLIICFVLALLAHLALISSRQELKEARQRVLAKQLRHLNNSFFMKLANEELPSGQWQCFQGRVQPGKESVTVNCKSEYSSDGLINFLEVKSKADNYAGQSGNADAVQRLCRLKMNFAEAQKKMAEKYVLTSKKATGLENLEQEALYIQASTEEVTLPALSFFQGKAASSITSDETVNEGLTRRFVYLNSSQIFTFKKNSVIRGQSIFTNKASIIIGATCHFPDRLAMYSTQGNITLEDNVRLDKALLHAYGTVTIGSGCKINGLIIANNIVLKGKADFSADADVLAAFASCAFSN